MSGNGCEHRKDCPLPYMPPPEHKPLPHPLVDLEKQGGLIYKLLRKVRRKSSPRRIRSEARDAAQVACCCEIHHLDRKTMTISIPGANGNVGIGYALIAKETGLRFGRVQRAFAVLYQIGWVESERKAYRLGNGQLRWLPSIRWFTRAFFLAMKKAGWFDSWTGRGQKKVQKKARAAEAFAKAQEAPSDDPLVALFQRVLRRAGGFGEVGLKLGQRLWSMINYQHKRDEDELLRFLELSMAARGPP
jgi:hypothetical protein